MRNKQVEFNPYMYTLPKLSRFGYEISVFNTQQGGIKNSRLSSRYIRHGNVTTEEWMSIFFLMFIVAENTGSVNMRILVRHSWRPSRFKCTKMKSFINTSYSSTLTLFAFHKKQYLDTFTYTKEKRNAPSDTQQLFDLLLRRVH